MRNGILVALAACALAACTPRQDGRRVIGSQAFGEPIEDLHTARIAGYSWDRPIPASAATAETPPAKPSGTDEL